MFRIFGQQLEVRMEYNEDNVLHATRYIVIVTRFFFFFSSYMLVDGCWLAATAGR
jgi:hypothetical protein